MVWVRCGLGTDTSILNLPTTNTASGSIAQFNTDLTDNLVKCECAFSASQASGTPTPANPISIDGVDKVNVTDCGKNLLPSLSSAVTVNHITFSPLSDGAIDIDGTASGNASVDVGRNEGCFLQAGTYYVNITATPYTITVFGIVDGTVTTIKNGGGLFTLTKPTQIFVRVFIANGTSVNHLRLPLQLETGSTATTYEPYSGTTALINLGGTYYGGSVDCVTGKMYPITKKGSLLKDLTWTYDSQYSRFVSNAVADIEVYSARTTPLRCSHYLPITDGRPISQVPNYAIYAVSKVIYINDSRYTDATTFANSLTNELVEYPLATPLVVYASNTAEIPTINGNNNCFCNTGNVSVKYNETIAHHIS